MTEKQKCGSDLRLDELDKAQLTRSIQVVKSKVGQTRDKTTLRLF